MDYSCGLTPNLSNSLRRGHIRKSFSITSRHSDGVDSNLKQQFAEQCRAFDQKCDADQIFLADLHEYYKKRSVLEQIYADDLSKLAASMKSKIHSEQAKRQNWPKLSYYPLAQSIIENTSKTAACHALFAETFGKQMTARLSDLMEDSQRCQKFTKELAQKCQETVLTGIHRQHQNYKDYFNTAQSVEDSKKMMEKSKEKCDKEAKRTQDKNKDVEKNLKLKKLREDLKQKSEVTNQFIIMNTKARNEYIVQICAANKGLDRYFNQEVYDVLQCLALGFHNSLVRTVLNHVSAERGLMNCSEESIASLNALVSNMNAQNDQKEFIDKYQLAFMQTNEMKFHSVKDDTICEVMNHPSLHDYLQTTATDLMQNIQKTKISFEEFWAACCETTKTLLTRIDLQDYEVGQFSIEHWNLSGLLLLIKSPPTTITILISLQTQSSRHRLINRTTISATAQITAIAT